MMSKYRNVLPQLRGGLFVTDAGLETTLIYHRGIDLPAFASFDLLKDDAGTSVLRRYYATYARMANRYGLGLVLESATWRANKDWGDKLGYDAERLARANVKAIALMVQVRECFEQRAAPMVISGNIGPRGDGYRPDARMTALQAHCYHATQIR